MKEEDIHKIALRNLSDTVVITDEEGMFTFICPNIHTIFGYTSDEVASMHNIHNLIGDLLIDGKTLDDRQEIINMEITARDKQVNEHVLLVNVKRVSANGGTRLYSFRDITDRKKAEKMTQAAVEAKEKLFSIIAHDLRSPFDALICFSELLLNCFEEYDNDRKKEYLGIIAVCSRHMHSLLENLLTWSTLHTDGIRLKPVKCNTANICSAQTELLKITAARKNIRICQNIGEDESVYADENMLALIFRNLISNAVKFSDSGGDIVISSRDTGEYSEITVSDEGAGIREGDIAELFRKNVHKSSQEKVMGSGMGLMLCSEFVEMNGGRIWAERRQEKGSNFMFTLPKWKD